MQTVLVLSDAAGAKQQKPLSSGAVVSHENSAKKVSEKDDCHTLTLQKMSAKERDRVTDALLIAIMLGDRFFAVTGLNNGKALFFKKMEKGR